MADSTEEVIKFRNKANGVVDDLRELDSVLAVIEDHGANDAERAAVFSDAFGEATDNQDITWSEFVAGLMALRAVRDAWDAGKVDAVKLVR